MSFVAAFSATDAQKELIGQLADTHNYDTDKVNSVLSNYGGFGVNDTAMEIIKATSRGDVDLYFPRYFGVNALKLVSIVRSIWPTLLDISPDMLMKDE